MCQVKCARLKTHGGADAPPWVSIQLTQRQGMGRLSYTYSGLNTPADWALIGDAQYLLIEYLLINGRAIGYDQQCG